MSGRRKGAAGTRRGWEDDREKTVVGRRVRAGDAERLHRTIARATDAPAPVPVPMMYSCDGGE